MAQRRGLGQAWELPGTLGDGRGAWVGVGVVGEEDEALSSSLWAHGNQAWACLGVTRRW